MDGFFTYTMGNYENFMVKMKLQVGEVCRLPTLTVTNEGKDAEDEFNTITFRVELNPKYGEYCSCFLAYVR